MTEIVAVAELIETAQLLVLGLAALAGIKDRIDDAFAHAKAKAARLCEAAETAQDLVKRVCRSIDELQTGFNQERRKQLRDSLGQLQRAVRRANNVMTDLEGKSRAQWFAFGDQYRQRIRNATQQVSAVEMISIWRVVLTYDGDVQLREAGQRLANVLAGPGTEASGVISMSPVSSAQMAAGSGTTFEATLRHLEAGMVLLREGYQLPM